MKSWFSTTVVSVCICVLMCPLCLFAAVHSLPDLDVTYIERAPRYVPGPWVYPKNGPQYMGVGNHRFTDEELASVHKQWPAAAEKGVTPASGRTNLNNDWVVMRLGFDDVSGKLNAPASFEFRDMFVKLQ